VVLVTHPRERLLATGPRHIVSGSERVVVRVWSAARVWAVRYSIDDGPWADLELSDDGHWQGRMRSDRLTKGIHSLAVVAVAADGIGGSQRIVFMVDPTGRYTAIPQVSPMVSDTQFC
jgi:3',5'-cyclic-AMP phosphodiesterase